MLLNSVRTEADWDDAIEPPSVFEAASVSQLGLYHDKNEDRAMYTKHFFAIADGVGGGSNGDIAAEVLLNYCTQIHNWQDSKSLQQAIIASEAIVQAALQQAGEQRGATTLAGAWLNTNGQGFISWVGDVRLYHLQIHNNQVQLSQLTIDQTYANLGEMASNGKQDSPARMIGTNAVGTPPVLPISLAEHDCLLILSDGVYRFVDTQDLNDYCQALRNPQASLNSVCQQLVEAAIDNQGYDDATALLVRFKPKKTPTAIVVPHIESTTDEQELLYIPTPLPVMAAWRKHSVWLYSCVIFVLCMTSAALGYGVAKATTPTIACPTQINIPSFKVAPLPELELLKQPITPVQPTKP